MFTVKGKRNDESYGYSTYLNFTKSVVKCDFGEKIQFQCLFCSEPPITCVLGSTYNVMKHLKNHCKGNEDLKTWVKGYEANNMHPPVNKCTITDETMRIVRYWVSRNNAYSSFDDKWFKKLFESPIPCSKTFKAVILDNLCDKIKTEIDLILENAVSIVLISDIWTSKFMLDFMGVAAIVIFSDFTKKTLVLGLDLMPGNHTAENIKVAIENIVNKYEYNKGILHGII